MTDFNRKRIDKLKKELRGSSAEEQLRILTLINELLASTDVALLLSLSLIHFLLGDDDEACSFLIRAKALDPNSHDVRRMELFLSATVGNQNAISLGESLVRDFPEDSWAKAMREKLLLGRLDSWASPPISGDWL